MGPVDVVIYDLLVTPKPPADIVQVTWPVLDFLHGIGKTSEAFGYLGQ